MKIIFLILLIVVVVGGVWWYTLGNKKEAEVSNNSAGGEASSADTSVAVLADGAYVVDVPNSELKWEGKKKFIPGYYDRGIIKIQSGSFVVSSGVVESGELTVDMSTIDVESTGRGSDESRLAKHLKSADFFDATNFPTAKFELVKITPVTGLDHTAEGSLTIKGITKAVNFPVKIYSDLGGVVVEGKAVIDRSLWNVRYGSETFFDNLGNNVIENNFSVSFKVLAQPK
ncbi:MAG: YceI family protein [bacterium]|nr:YceI family protein [bacterium]